MLVASLLAMLLPMLSVANKLKEVPSEGMSSEYLIASEDEPYESGSKLTSIVLEDTVYCFEAVSGNLYIKKVSPDLELLTSNTIDFSDDVWNLTVTNTADDELSVYFRSNRKLFRLTIDAGTLSVIGEQEVLATDVTGFAASGDYLFYYDDDKYALYKGEDLLQSASRPSIKSAKFVINNSSNGLLSEPVEVVFTNKVNGKNRINYLHYNPDLVDYEVLDVYTEEFGISVGSLKSVVRDDKAIYTYTSVYKTVNGNKSTHLIIGKIIGEKFEIVDAFDKKVILDEGIISGVVDEVPEMISLFSTRTGVELYRWKVGEMDRREKLTLSLSAKKEINYYTVDSDNILLWFDVGHADIQTMMASSNPELIDKSMYVKPSMYINIAVMILGSMMFTFVVLTLIPLVLYVFLAVGVNSFIGRFFKDKPNSPLRLGTMSVLTLLLGVYLYFAFVLSIFDKTRYITVYVKNPVLLIISFVVIYVSAYLFANWRSFEIVGEDSSGKWIMNFAISFFMLFTFNFLQYYFLSSFIANLI